jgi:3-hydroxybutyryl-CoA dehydrogenase
MKKDLVENPNEDFTSMTNLLFENILLNFGFASKEEKKSLIRKNTDKLIFMDLTCYDPAEFYQEFPQLMGCFAALFCDEEKKVEIHQRIKNDTFLAKMIELGFTPIETSIISCGFIFPRTISQIINEAHFALEENVASKNDIDRGMKYGVNYPKGPFEWSKGREIYVLTLLDELYQKTKDKRYLPSRLLK